MTAVYESNEDGTKEPNKSLYTKLPYKVTNTQEHKKPPIINCKKSAIVLAKPNEESVLMRSLSAKLALPSTLDDVTKLLEESKEREERMKKRLEQFRESAKLAVTQHNANRRTSNGGQEIVNHLAQYKKEITNFKTSMDNILQVTKETHNEVQKTKDLVAIIDGSQGKLGGSFQSKFVEDEDVEIFKEKSEVENPGTPQESPMPTVNDDEGVSTLFLT